MTGRRRTLVAVVTAAVLGLVAGVVAAFVIPDHTVPRSKAGSDPLNLGIPLENQPCSGQDLLIVASGDTHNALAAGVRDNTGVKYLRTAQSCGTWWDRGNQPTPAYTAYLGPYDAGTSRGCQLRMTAAHRGDAVTRLDDGAKQFVVCVCELSSASAPALSPGMTVNVGTGIWIRALKEILQDLGLNRTGDLSGTYDPLTQGQVKKFQQVHDLSITGSVEEETWRTLRRRACPKYDY